MHLKKLALASLLTMAFVSCGGSGTAPPPPPDAPGSVDEKGTKLLADAKAAFDQGKYQDASKIMVELQKIKKEVKLDTAEKADNLKHDIDLKIRGK